MKNYQQSWTLSPLLYGKGDSYKEINTHLDVLSDQIDRFEILLPSCFSPLQIIDSELSEIGSLMACLTGIDTQDIEATKLEAKYSALLAKYETLHLKIDQTLKEMSDDAFSTLIESVKELSFILKERRDQAKGRMSLEKEALATDLAISGHLCFSTLYFTFMGSLSFPFEQKSLSLGKLENLFSDADRSIRKEAIDSLETTLTKNETLFAHFLNNIVDFRLQLYKHRGWKDDVHGSLIANRMTKKTLDTMWHVIAKNKKMLKKYLERKKELLQLKEFSFSDIYAPLGSQEETKIAFHHGAEKILSFFEKMPKMHAFIKKALENGWIDAMPREKKRAGGFCTSAPLTKESRILMTYMDNFSSVSTLAHELGHAFHSHVLFDLPPLLQHYPMNVAETASTMFEMIVADRAIKETKDKKEKLILLDDKISSYLAFNMDIHSRYIFETNLHKKRKEGFISPEELSHMMVEAEKIGFDHNLDQYLPHFWAYKMHFYFTDITFYNWPYTFGYLLSLGIYNLLFKDPNFEERYIAFLQDTGNMQIEDLLMKHLKIDLTQDAFWQGAIDVIDKDIEEFLLLTT